MSADGPKLWAPRIVYPLQPAEHFVGRQGLRSELVRWATSTHEDTRLIAVIGMGGAGKTALTENVLSAVMERPRHSGLFVWSFYENRSIEEFADFALQYFGRQTPSAPLNVRLRRLVDTLADGNNHLLVLDGLELLQEGLETNRVTGELSSHDLKLFFRLFVGTASRAMVLVTSRLPLTDLESWRGRRFRVIDLDNERLSDSDARAVLSAWGVRGTEAELASAVAMCGTHPLSVSVLGSFLAEYHGGRVQGITLVDVERATTDLTSARRLVRVLDEYRKRLDARDNTLMFILSAFSRGVSEYRLFRLFPSSSTASASESELLVRLARLRRLGLCHVYTREGIRFFTAHPFVREYFRAAGNQESETLYEHVAERLAEQLSDRPDKQFPKEAETLLSFEDLIEQLVAAEKYDEAFEVYFRGMGGYAHLTAIGQVDRGLRIVSLLLREDQAGRIESRCVRPEAKRSTLRDRMIYSRDVGNLRQARAAWHAYERVATRYNSGRLSATNVVLHAMLLLIEAGALPEAAILCDDLAPLMHLDGCEPNQQMRVHATRLYVRYLLGRSVSKEELAAVEPGRVWGVHRVWLAEIALRRGLQQLAKSIIEAGDLQPASKATLELMGVELALERGQLEGASKRLRDCRRALEERYHADCDLRWQVLQGVCTARLGDMASGRGELTTALHHAQSNGNILREVDALVRIGELEFLAKNYLTSYQFLVEAVSLGASTRVSYHRGVAPALPILAAVEERLGRPGSALCSIDWAIRLYEAMGDGISKALGEQRLLIRERTHALDEQSRIKRKRANSDMPG